MELKDDATTKSERRAVLRALLTAVSGCAIQFRSARTRLERGAHANETQPDETESRRDESK